MQILRAKLAPPGNAAVYRTHLSCKVRPDWYIAIKELRSTVITRPNLVVHHETFINPNMHIGTYMYVRIVIN